MQIKTKNVSCQTANSKRIKLEVKGTVILPPLVFPGLTIEFRLDKIFTLELTNSGKLFILEMLNEAEYDAWSLYLIQHTLLP